MDDMGSETKKLALLRIYQILERYSDSEHPMTQNAIADRLERDHGITMERKAVGRNIHLLEEAGIGIGSCGNKGVYLDDRPFEEGELRLLIDSVIFSRHIPPKYAKNLVDRLSSFGGEYFGKSVTLVESSDQMYCPQSKDIFLFVEDLNDAIANRWKVSFLYHAYGTDKCLHPIWKNARVVNPYRLVASNDHYFLIGNIDIYDNLTSFRLDKITDLQILKTPRKPIRDTSTGEFRVGEYLSAHPFMQTGKPVHVVAHLNRNHIEAAIDAFGDNFRVLDEGEEMVTIDARVNEDDAYLWALQNGDAVEILEPQSLRNRLRSTVRTMQRMYLRTDSDAFDDAISLAKRDNTMSINGHPVQAQIGREDLSNLHMLHLAKTDVSDLNFLNNCKDMQVVRIVDAPAADFSPVASLPKLCALEIRTTNMTSIDYLRGMSLEELILADDPIADFSPLYEMKSLSHFTTGTETVDLLDLERLRAAYPGIQINVKEDIEKYPPAIYLSTPSKEYPSNVVESVFYNGYPFTVDEVGLEAFLKEYIPVRLTEEEVDIFRKRFRDGKSRLQIALEEGVPVDKVTLWDAVILRKLRHPCFSRPMAKYITLQDPDEE